MKYIITKRSPDGRIYTINIYSNKELAEHISACFEATREEILGVLKVN